MLPSDPNPNPQLLHDFQDFFVVPNLLNKGQVTDAFRDARFGPSHDASDVLDDIGRIGAQEFMECIGRCALIAYNYQVGV